MAADFDSFAYRNLDSDDSPSPAPGHDA